MATIPFVVGQWVRGVKFYGRAAQIEEILEGNRNSIWLLGTRRIGKTSLLKELEHITAGSPERGYFPSSGIYRGPRIRRSSTSTSATRFSMPKNGWNSWVLPFPMWKPTICSSLWGSYGESCAPGISSCCCFATRWRS